MNSRTRRRHVLPAVVLLAAATVGMPASAAARTPPPEDPNLEQTLGDLGIATDQRVLEVGHVDLGPKYDGGEWRFLIHDDVAKADANATSVWRHPDRTVLRVLDTAMLPVPDDPAYGFVGAEPGSPVWVVPQTQNPEAVWLGWNTQDPEVMSRVDRGVTLSLTGADGPGTVTVYLQSGSFGEPQVLWDSRIDEPQPIWVDVNTHTHANWVFTEPGVYLLELTAEADLVDGSTAVDRQVLRFAVGTDTPVEDAFAATWSGAAGTSPEPAPDDAEPAATSGSDPLVPVLIGAIAVAAVVLAVGFGVAIARGQRVRRRALARPDEEARA